MKLPTEVNGPQQKGAYIRGMKDWHSGVTDLNECANTMIFYFWMHGRRFAEENPNIDCFKGFKEMLSDFQNKTI